MQGKWLSASHSATGMQEFGGKGVMTVLAGNPSRWGPRAKCYVEKSKFDIIGLAETHVAMPDLELEVSRRIPGRSHWWTAAVESGNHMNETNKRFANHGGGSPSLAPATWALRRWGDIGLLKGIPRK